MDTRTGAATPGPRGAPGSTLAAAAASPAGRFRPDGHGWPLFSGLGPVGALATAPGVARGFTSAVLAGWGLAPLIVTAELVVSELASNVVTLAAGPDGRPAYRGSGITELWLRLTADEAALRVEVWDNLPATAGVPVIRHAGPDAESGRGLELIAALSTRWGWDPVPGTRAKSVWALVAIQ